jgi:cytidine deaminase
MISKPERNQLVTAAVNARLNAYAPYSKFRVGAAVLADSGKVFAACNVENASYGLTICAERNAIFKAVSEGETRLTALVLCLEGGGSPCGACRQVIHEFGPDIPILACDPDGQLVSETTVDRLLPEAFGPDSLHA